MTPESLDPLLKFLSTAGVTGALVFLVVAFMRGDIIPGKAHREEVANLRSDNARLLAERNQAFDELRQMVQLGAAVQNARKVRI